MEAKNKVMGLDGKMYDEVNYVPTVSLSEENPDMKTGMIMDGVTTHQGTSTSAEFNKTMNEAMPKLDEKTLQRLIAYQNRKPSIREFEKIGRNDPCPCGSGKKFKNCCMRTKDWNKLIKKQ